MHDRKTKQNDRTKIRTTYTLIIHYTDTIQKYLLKNIWKRNRRGTFDSCFNDPVILKKLTGLELKRRQLVFTCCQWDIFILILRTVLYPSAEEHSRRTQATKMDLFAIIVKGFILTLLTILVNTYVVDVSSANTLLTFSNTSN